MSKNMALGETTDALQDFYSYLTYTHEITRMCYYGFSTTFAASTYSNLASVDGMGLNVLYNLGYIYTDIYMLVTGDTSNAGYSYYLFYHIGDFTMRFLYRDES